MKKVNLESLVSLCKRRGFLYPGSEIYGGLSGVWDFGPLGAQLKHNLLQSWWQTFVERRPDIYGLDSAILMNPQVWRASGHEAGFTDPLVEDLVTKERFRVDHLLEAQGLEIHDLDLEQLAQLMKKHNLKSPDGNQLSPPRQFNMMLKTQMGATDSGIPTYLRPETAQGIFVNFRHVVDNFQPDLPFGIAQIGKAFRNEISPRDFLFRLRELEQMEIEYFCQEEAWPQIFESLKKDIYLWLTEIGLDQEKITENEVPENMRAHYSQKTIDFEFDFSFGTKELIGLACRGNYDLKQHQEASGKSLFYTHKVTQEKILPVCVEPSFGVERLILALLETAYTEDKAHDRIYLALKPELAPIKYAVSPLVANKPELVKYAQKVFNELQAKYGCVAWDDHGNIGKRYRRQDEIGTPWTIVVDFQTLKDHTVTKRDRDTLEQTRLKIEQI